MEAVRSSETFDILPQHYTVSTEDLDLNHVSSIYVCSVNFKTEHEAE